MLKTIFSTIVITSALAVSSASAETIRWARAGDAITMDPHAQNDVALRMRSIIKFMICFCKEIWQARSSRHWQQAGRHYQIIQMCGDLTCAKV